MSALNAIPIEIRYQPCFTLIDIPNDEEFQALSEKNNCFIGIVTSGVDRVKIPEN